MDLDGNLQVFNNPKTLTTVTTLSDNSINQATAGRHAEMGDPIGFGIFVFSEAKLGTETYEFQVVQADDEALSVNLEVIEDTTAMANTDVRIDPTSANYPGGFFLGIPIAKLTRQYFGLRYLGANSASMVIHGAWLMNRAEWEQYVAQPANYTP